VNHLQQAHHVVNVLLNCRRDLWCRFQGQSRASVFSVSGSRVTSRHQSITHGDQALVESIEDDSDIFAGAEVLSILVF
jgi:hypothetical protein